MGPGLRGRAAAACMLGLDLSLQLEQTVEDILRARGAAWDIDIYWYDRVNSHDGCIVVIEAARAGANPKRDDPLRLGHLIIDSLQHGQYLVADRAYHEQH